MGGEPQAGREDLETGEAKGTPKTAEASEAVAQRRFVRPSAAAHAQSCVGLRLLSVRTHDGRGVKLLTVMDEYTRECLAIRAERSIRSSDVIETLTELMTARGVPMHIRSDNGPEFTARVVRE